MYTGGVAKESEKMSDPTWEGVVRYRVYSIERGLLVEPGRDDLNMGSSPRYSDYPTQEEAVKDIADNHGVGLVVLPVVYSHPHCG